MIGVNRDVLEMRNEQWSGNELIPSWVDVSTVELDRFFTRPEIASQCYAHLKSVLELEFANLNDYCFVEPSAGKGSFYNLLPDDRRIGLDIVPDNPEYQIADYLSWSPRANGRRFIVIGNPPFGYRGWLALAFMNHSAKFADYIGMILPMSFQSDGKGSPKHRVIGAELLHHENLPSDSFINEEGQTAKINALWQVWKRGVNNRAPVKTCNTWIDLFTVDNRVERLCGHNRINEADWFLQRTFYGESPQLVKEFSQVKYGCGYGIVIKKQYEEISNVLRNVNWREYSNLAMHNCCHISMYHIQNAVIDKGFIDV